MTKNSEIKIPSFISESLSAMKHEEKNEAIERYKRWYNGEFTELFIQYLEEEYDRLLKEDEGKSDFLSKFQFSYVTIRNKAKRALLRSLITKLDYKA